MEAEKMLSLGVQAKWGRFYMEKKTDRTAADRLQRQFVF